MGICRTCWQSLEPWDGPVCSCCGLPFVSGHALDADQPRCALCREEAFNFDGARSYGLYAGTLRAVILQLKFQRRERLGRKLGQFLLSLWGWVAEACPDEPPVLVPVPLHTSRERERGFNQAELLAQGLARGLARAHAVGAPRVETRWLRRTRATAPQTGLSLRARQENVRGVFSVVRPERVRARAVVLVDDVMTTGATLSACALALKDAGAQLVLGLTLARATPEFPDVAPHPAAQTVDDFNCSRR